MPGLLHLAGVFWRDERGATAIEYALLAAIGGLVIVGSVAALGNSLWERVADISDRVQAAVAAED